MPTSNELWEGRSRTTVPNRNVGFREAPASQSLSSQEEEKKKDRIEASKHILKATDEIPSLLFPPLRKLGYDAAKLSRSEALKIIRENDTKPYFKKLAKLLQKEDDSYLALAKKMQPYAASDPNYFPEEVNKKLAKLLPPSKKNEHRSSSAPSRRFNQDDSGLRLRSSSTLSRDFLSNPETLLKMDRISHLLDRSVTRLDSLSEDDKRDVMNASKELGDFFKNISSLRNVDQVTKRKLENNLNSYNNFRDAVTTEASRPNSNISTDELFSFLGSTMPENTHENFEKYLQTRRDDERMGDLPKPIKTRVQKPDGTYENVDETSEELIRRHALKSGLEALKHESPEPLIAGSVLRPSDQQLHAEEDILDELEGRENYTNTEDRLRHQLLAPSKDEEASKRLNEATSDLKWADDLLHYSKDEAKDLRRDINDDDISKYDLTDRIDSWLDKLRTKAERNFRENEEKYDRAGDARIGQFINRGSWNSGSRIAVEDRLQKEKERRRRDFEADMNELEARTRLESGKSAISNAVQARNMGRDFYLKQTNERMNKDNALRNRQLTGANLQHSMHHNNLRTDQNRAASNVALEHDLLARRMAARNYKKELADRDQEINRKGIVAHISDLDTARTAPFRKAERLQHLINGTQPTNTTIFNPSLSATPSPIPPVGMARTSELNAPPPPPPNTNNQLLGLGLSGIGHLIGNTGSSSGGGQWTSSSGFTPSSAIQQILNNS